MFDHFDKSWKEYEDYDDYFLLILLLTPLVVVVVVLLPLFQTFKCLPAYSFATYRNIIKLFLLLCSVPNPKSHNWGWVHRILTRGSDDYK